MPLLLVYDIDSDQHGHTEYGCHPSHDDAEKAICRWVMIRLVGGKGQDSSLRQDKTNERRSKINHFDGMNQQSAVFPLYHNPSDVHRQFHKGESRDVYGYIRGICAVDWMDE